MAASNTDSCDIAIVGGGLAGGLAALALAAKRPGLDVRLVEPGQNPQQRRFACAVSPDQAHAFARSQRKIRCNIFQESTSAEKPASSTIF